jgi:hypothetical protein
VKDSDLTKLKSSQQSEKKEQNISENNNSTTANSKNDSEFINIYVPYRARKNVVKKITSPESVPKKSPAAPKKKSVDGDVSKGKGPGSSKDKIELNVATNVQVPNNSSTAPIDSPKDPDNPSETPCSNDKVELNIIRDLQEPTTVSNALIDSPKHPDDPSETPRSDDKVYFNIARDVELSTAQILLNL